jgi:iron complex outermembrane receptor protein
LKDQSRAIFAQGTYKLTEKLSLTGGLRYTWDKLSARQLAGSLFGTAFPTEQTSSSNPSWTVTLDYQATPSLLVYVTQRGSWRTGGYNYNVYPVNNTANDPVNPGNRFLPETTKDVEVGVKYSGRDLGVPFTFNAAVYNQWVSNIQRALLVPGVAGTVGLFTNNVPEARITGVEADTSVRPTRWLTLGGSLAYTHARYTQGHVVVQGTPTTYGPFADAPKWIGNVYFDISHMLAGNAGTLSLHAELYAQSKLYFSNVAGTVAPGTTLNGYSLTNLRLSWNEMFGSKLSSAFYVRNLFNKKYYAGANAAGPSLGINTSVPGQPRMFGGELRFEF